MFKDIDEMFDNMFTSTRDSWGTWPIDVYTTEKELNIELAVPGKTKENIELSHKRDNGCNQLKIVITSDEKEPEEERNYIVRKVKRNNNQTLTISIPEKYDMGSLSAKCDNGLLVIKLRQLPELDEIKYTIE